MKKMIIAAMSFCLLVGHPSMAAEIQVNPGYSIQSAIDSASDGDTVRVTAGTYNENIRIQNKSIQLLGASRNMTFLQGDGTDSVVTLLDTGTSKVDGFTISGGTRSTQDEYYNRGGGVYCYGGSPIISNNIIEKNDSRYTDDTTPQGGGIFSGNADIKITNNIIRNNHSGFGGGVCINGGTAVVIHANTIEGNTCHTDHGGGLAISSLNAQISNNFILNNRVAHPDKYGWGGGILVFGAEAKNVKLSHNTIVGNFAPSMGGGIFIDEGAEVLLENELIYGNKTREGSSGIYVDGEGEGNPEDAGSKAVIINCTIADNEGGYRGGIGICIERNSEVIVRDSIFWGNFWHDVDNETDVYDDFVVDGTSSISVTYSISMETISGIGNTNKDPLFINNAEGDYHLKLLSPAIDAGDPASDHVNEPSHNGGRVNMGRYGNTSEAAIGIQLEHAISILKTLTGVNAPILFPDINNDNRIGHAEVVYILWKIAK